MLCNGLDWNVSFYGDIIGSLYRDVDHHIIYSVLGCHSENENLKTPKPHHVSHSIHQIQKLCTVTHKRQPKKDVSSHTRLTCGAAKDRSKDRSSNFTELHETRGWSEKPKIFGK